MSEEKTRVVIAVGGNAIHSQNQKGTYKKQLQNMQETCQAIGNMILSGEYKVVISHGNGPQIGAILLQNDAGEKEGVPPMPMEVCVAQSQGMIGYMIQQSLDEVFRKAGHPDIPVATMITQTIIDENDPAFKNPNKPIGPSYSEEKAKSLEKEKGWNMEEMEKGDWRRVVPSPKPVDIAEKRAIKKLYEAHIVPIVAGGGGIPVVDKDGRYIGKPAVVDKDFGAEQVAEVLDAELFVILTDVSGVALNYGEEDERWLKEAGLGEMKKYLEEGHFGEGSMKPKVESAIKFLESGGEKVVIASLDEAAEAVEGKCGTEITKKS